MKTLLVVVDTETTGADEDAEFVQLGSVLQFEGCDEVFTFDELANPGKPIGPEAQAVHGITDAHVAPARPSREVALTWWEDVLEMASQEGECKVIFAGHNIPFDLRVLSRHIPAHYFTHTLDSLRLAWRTYPDAAEHKLEFLYRDYFKLSSSATTKAHNALVDCHMVAELLGLWQAHGMGSYSEMQEALDVPVALSKMPYGKHKGQKFIDLPVTYLEFMVTKLPETDDVGYSICEELRRRGPQMVEVIEFGKHSGTLVKNLPRGYVQWLRKQDNLAPSLRRALDYHF